MRDRQWNLERFIVFQTVILQQARHVTACHAILQHIGKRMDSWKAGRHGMLVEKTLHTCAQHLTVSHREESKEPWAKTYHSLVLQGKLRMTVLWITERETGVYLSPCRGAQRQGRG